MKSWTPEFLFYFTYAVSALTSVGIELRSEKKLKPWYLVGTVAVFGALGGGIGMLVYEYGSGKEHPWLVVCCGMLVGARAIKPKDVTALARRLLQIPLDTRKKEENEQDDSSNSS